MKCKICGKEIPEDQVLEFTGTGAVYGSASLESFRAVGISWLVSDSEDEQVKCPSCGELTDVEYSAGEDALEEVMPAQFTGKQFNAIVLKSRTYDIEDAKKAGMLARRMKGVVYTAVDAEGKIFHMRGWHVVNRLYYTVVWKIDKTKLKPRNCMNCQNLNVKTQTCAPQLYKGDNKAAVKCKEFF
jgi:hypothetical protein